MTAILLTGMSGTGKSTVIAELGRRGLDAVDTDHGGYIDHATAGVEPLWCENRITTLLDRPRSGPLFLSGCVANQHLFYPRLTAIVLLSAPLDTVLRRVSTRTTNPFGRTADDRARIAADLRDVEPLLRADASVEIDTRSPLDDVVARILALADR